jgi:hypothetical protein
MRANSVPRLAVFLLFLLPIGDDLLDLLGPLDLSATAVAVFGLEKHLMSTVVAEKSLLLGFFGVGDLRNLRALRG